MSLRAASPALFFRDPVPRPYNFEYQGPSLSSNSAGEYRFRRVFSQEYGTSVR
jgi:hypothetical protein